MSLQNLSGWWTESRPPWGEGKGWARGHCSHSGSASDGVQPRAALVEGERGDHDLILDVWKMFWRDVYSSFVEGRCLHARPHASVNFAAFFSILVVLQRRGHHPHLLDKEIAAQRDSGTCLQARVRLWPRV